jgi:hypothetical protein
MHFVFSYHYNSDREFVEWIAEKLALNGIDSWFLDNIDNSKDPPIFKTKKDNSYEVDWRIKQQNWQATWLDHLIDACGVIIVSSEYSLESQKNPGRGMWREFDAITYIYEDDPSRIVKIEKSNFRTDDSYETKEEISRLVQWAQKVYKLPPVKRIKMNDDLDSWNNKLGAPGKGIWPEMKTKSSIWYELIRLDIYDVEWQCRKCCLKSFPYMFGEVLPPSQCPRCAFSGHPENDEGETQLSSQEIEFLLKIKTSLDVLKKNWKSK